MLDLEHKKELKDTKHQNKAEANIPVYTILEYWIFCYNKMATLMAKVTDYYLKKINILEIYCYLSTKFSFSNYGDKQ